MNPSHSEGLIFSPGVNDGIEHCGVMAGDTILLKRVLIRIRKSLRLGLSLVNIIQRNRGEIA
jgi:hypothetical protein